MNRHSTAGRVAFKRMRAILLIHLTKADLLNERDWLRQHWPVEHGGRPVSHQNSFRSRICSRWFIFCRESLMARTGGTGESAPDAGSELASLQTTVADFDLMAMKTTNPGLIAGADNSGEYGPESTMLKMKGTVIRPHAMTRTFSLSHYAKRLIMFDYLAGDTDHHPRRSIDLSRDTTTTT